MFDARNVSTEKTIEKNGSACPVRSLKPYYSTKNGHAYLTDTLDGLRATKSDSVNLIFTSPPYALHFKKAYGNVDKKDYVEWFLKFAVEMFRVLTPDGSFVLNIGGSYNKGTPTRSLYHFKLLIALVEEIGFHLAQECFWYNPAKMPMPAEWVTVRKVRIKDSVEYLWWLSKTPHPKATNQAVLKQSFSPDMHRLNKRGLRETTRPGGYVIKSSWADIKTKGAIPSNYIEQPLIEEPAEVAESVIRCGNNAANDRYTVKCKEEGIKIHPARFPAALPQFFIKMLTTPGDLVMDTFAGSNTTGAVAEELDRRWIAFDNVEEYLKGSQYRFFM